MNFFVIGLLLVNSIVYIQARSRPESESGGMHIELTHGKLRCGMIECPSNTDRCEVSVSNQENRNVLKHAYKCLSQKNEILSEGLTLEATDPSNKIHEVTAVQGAANSKKFNKKEFDEKMERNRNKLKANLEKMQLQFQKRREERERKMQESRRQLQNWLAQRFY